jgi:hypothetical protein
MRRQRTQPISRFGFKLAIRLASDRAELASMIIARVHAEALAGKVGLRLGSLSLWQ